MSDIKLGITLYCFTNEYCGDSMAYRAFLKQGGKTETEVK